MSEESQNQSPEVKVKAITLKPNRTYITRFLEDTQKNQRVSNGMITDSAEEVLESLYVGATLEPEVIRETVEVPAELQEGESILKLSPEQRKVLEVIAQKRQVAYKFPEPETPETVLLRCFFTKAYLFNYFNEFYTGLKAEDLKKAEQAKQVQQKIEEDEDR